jgi:hypothetical protein
VPLVAVRANRCQVGVGAEQLRIAATTVVNDYPEAVALVACLKAGVSWESIRRPIRPLYDLNNPPRS